MRRSPGSPEVAFVWPGGGSHGAGQVGILRSLIRAGIRPDLMVGSSVGALNAAFFAVEPSLRQVDAMEALWRRLARRDVFGSGRHRTAVRLLTHRDHLWSPRPLRQLIRECCPVEDLSDLAVPVEVVTTDLDNAVARWWHSGPTVDVLCASACLPGLLPPVILDGHRHVDGGVLEPAPVQRAVDLDATTVYVLGEISALDEEASPRLTALEVLVRSFAVSRYARLPDPASLARPGQRVIVVPGADTSGVDLTDFSHTARLLAEGEARSREFLAPVPVRAGTRFALSTAAD